MTCFTRMTWTMPAPALLFKFQAGPLFSSGSWSALSSRNYSYLLAKVSEHSRLSQRGSLGSYNTGKSRRWRVSRFLFRPNRASPLRIFPHKPGPGQTFSVLAPASSSPLDKSTSQADISSTPTCLSWASLHCLSAAHLSGHVSLSLASFRFASLSIDSASCRFPLSRFPACHRFLLFAHRSMGRLHQATRHQIPGLYTAQGLHNGWQSCVCVLSFKSQFWGKK
jgi:hypothetical protein